MLQTAELRALPNLRLQRTRSAPLRSPLSRKLSGWARNVSSVRAAAGWPVRSSHPHGSSRNAAGS